jgi:hypothetical protein
MPQWIAHLRRDLPRLRSALALAILLPFAAAAQTPPALPGLASHGLVAVGRIAADTRDKFGETTISSSGLAIDRNAWRRDATGYHGIVYLLPDRGWNTTGTIDYRPRLHKVAISFNPAEPKATVTMTLADTILLTDAAGAPLTGLDPIGVRPAADGFPDMPLAANGRISLDSEAVVLMPDGSFFISDEYGPYIYRFSAAGRMLGAIRPPDALIPMRKGRQNFSSNNPGPGAAAPVPPNPETGRQNNQGFEGLALTPDGRTLAVILQSATRQDGGTSPETRQYTRMLFYDVSDPAQPKLTRHVVVELPAFTDAKGRRRIAAQSELLAIGNDRFLLLCRDGDNGYGLKNATSAYRRVDVIDLSGATNLIGTPYQDTTPVAPGGRLATGIKVATLSSFIDLNDNAQLGRFGLHNGEPNDRDNLSEKWESMGLAPALDPEHPRDFFLLVGNDNDFITQHGFQAGADYKDPSGVDIDTLMLVYRVTLPAATK